MNQERVTVIHDRSEEADEAESYLTNNTANTVSISFGDRDPDIPVVIGDWYWIVIGADSTMYELQAEKHGRGAIAYKFKR